MCVRKRSQTTSKTFNAGTTHDVPVSVRLYPDAVVTLSTVPGVMLELFSSTPATGIKHVAGCRLGWLFVWIWYGCMIAGDDWAKGGRWRKSACQQGSCTDLNEFDPQQ